MSDVLWPEADELDPPAGGEDDRAVLADVLAALDGPEHALLVLRRAEDDVTALCVVFGGEDVAVVTYGVGAEGRVLEAGMLPHEDAIPEILDRTRPWPPGAAWLELQRLGPDDAVPRLIDRFVAADGAWEPLPPGAELPGEALDLPELIDEARGLLADWVFDLEWS
jgi:hypothetical protein